MTGEKVKTTRYFVKEYLFHFQSRFWYILYFWPKPVWSLPERIVCEILEESYYNLENESVGL